VRSGEGYGKAREVTLKTGLRILVIDDEEDIRGVLSRVLEAEGHDVTLASSGEDGLEFYKADPFPLVITDMNLGGMDGIQLLREIRMIDPDCLVVIITSSASMETSVKALRYGAYDYLFKPFEDLALVTSVVDRAVQRIRLLHENKALIESLRRKKDELEQLNSKLREMAIRDGLTGLHDHRYFQDTLATELARGNRHGRVFSLLFLDVDYFKRYNDANGHLAGDSVLKGIAAILRMDQRATTTIARYGGEEFVLLLPETGKEGALQVAEAIRKRVYEHRFPAEERQPEGNITVSIGVATFPEDGIERDTLIRCADQALYKAKQKGRNAVSDNG
jgi:diguanylate cyclase (GGDEF)-like protein